MTYPAMPKFPTATTTSFEGLTQIKEGQEFVLRGYVCKATKDAVTYTRNGFETILLPALRANPAMPSGWELADVHESRAVKAPLGELMGGAEA